MSFPELDLRSFSWFAYTRSAGPAFQSWTLSKNDADPALCMGTREDWMLYRGPGFLVVVWFAHRPHSLPSPSVSSTGDTQEDWARICIHLRSPGIDSKTSTPPAYIAGGPVQKSYRNVRPCNRFLGSLNYKFRLWYSATSCWRERGGGWGWK